VFHCHELGIFSGLFHDLLPPNSIFMHNVGNDVCILLHGKQSVIEIKETKNIMGHTPDGPVSKVCSIFLGRRWCNRCYRRI